MCGIAAVLRKDAKPAQKQLLKHYHKQKARGQEGFGYITLSGKVKRKRFAFEHEVEVALSRETDTAILFHHRYPTSTVNVPEAAHPIKVSHAELLHDYFVVHNGIITNADVLKENHDKLGYAYETLIKTEYVTHKGKKYYGDTEFNDSEALAIELARCIEGKENICHAHGAIAYIVAQVNKITGEAIALYFGTNGGNPLTLQETQEGVVIASEGGKAMADNQCYRYDMQTREMKSTDAIVCIEYPVVTYPKRGMGFTQREYSDIGMSKNPTIGTLEADIEEMHGVLEDLQQQIFDAMSLGDEDMETELLHASRQAETKLHKLQAQLETLAVQIF